MTALRQNVVNMVENAPEEVLSLIMEYLKEICNKEYYTGKKTIEDESYFALLRMIKPIPDLDEKKELEEYRSERYCI